MTTKNIDKSNVVSFFPTHFDNHDSEKVISTSGNELAEVYITKIKSEQDRGVFDAKKFDAFLDRLKVRVEEEKLSNTLRGTNISYLQKCLIKLLEHQAKCRSNEASEPTSHKCKI